MTLRRLPELVAAAALVPAPTGPSTPTWSAPAGRPATAGSSGCCRWSGRTSWCGSWRGCSTRTSSCPRTGCGRCPGTHLDKPFTVSLGGQDFTVGYEPAESTSGLFGGNSNWRGPIWMPVNFLLIERAARVRARSSATTCWWSTRPARAASCTLGADRRRPVPAADRAVRARRGRPPPDLRRHRAVPDPPGLAGPGGVPGVLPRRQRRRAWAPGTRPAGRRWWPT